MFLTNSIHFPICAPRHGPFKLIDLIGSEPNLPVIACPQLFPTPKPGMINF